MVLGLPKSLHKKAARLAEQDGVSLNQFIVAGLAERVGERAKPSTSIVSFIADGFTAPIGGNVSGLTGGIVVTSVVTGSGFSIGSDGPRLTTIQLSDNVLQAATQYSLTYKELIELIIKSSETSTKGVGCCR